MVVTCLQVNQGVRQTIEEFKREGHSMRSYVLVATILFVLLTLVQLTRLFLRWPVFVAGLSIPLWVSGASRSQRTWRHSSNYWDSRSPCLRRRILSGCADTKISPLPSGLSVSSIDGGFFARHFRSRHSPYLCGRCGYWCALLSLLDG